MRAQLILVMVLGACSPGQDVATTRQAVSVDSMPVAIGLPADRLGAAMATCPDQLVIAGAPGRNGYWLSDGGARSGPTTAGLGEVVACDDAPLLGGLGGLWRADGAIVAAAQVRCAAARTGAVAYVETLNPSLLVVKLVAGAPRIATVGCTIDSLKWVSESRLLLGCPSTGKVFVAELSTSALTARLLFDGGVPLAGRSLASGDVWWPPGDELVVGAEQKVLVFDQDGGFLTALHGTHPSFGAALEITPSEYVVGRLWVGEPDNGLVWAFVGDAGTPLGPFPPSFGATLARSGDKVFVGAPSDSLGAGAVYASRPGLLTSTDSVAMACAPGTCPAVNCVPADCIGGVVCSYSGLGFCADAGEEVDAGELDAGGDAGSADAGAPDAGGGDAGSADAGGADAGGADAGGADAGGADAGGADAGADAGGADADAGADAGGADAGAPIHFVTSGCSTGATGPLLALVLALWRRR